LCGGGGSSFGQKERRAGPSVEKQPKREANDDESNKQRSVVVYSVNDGDRRRRARNSRQLDLCCSNKPGLPSVKSFFSPLFKEMGSVRVGRDILLFGKDRGWAGLGWAAGWDASRLRRMESK